MNCLMNLNSLYIIFFSLIFCDECLHKWYDFNIDNLDSTEIVNLKSDFYLKTNKVENKINLYIDNYNSKIKIDIEDEIYFFDYIKSIKIYKSTNQMYIDYPDSMLINNIRLLFNKNKDYFINSFTKLDEYKYRFIYDFNMHIVLKNNCQNIHSIILYHNELKFELFNLELDVLSNNIDYFSLDSNYFKYDMR